MKAWALRETSGFDGLDLVDLPEPERGPSELLVQVTTSALNYRDTLLLKGGYGSQQKRANLIPGGDGAGRVVALGPRVTQFAVGDRVTGNLYQNWDRDGLARNCCELSLARVVLRNVRLEGVTVGNREGLETMIRAIASN